MDTLRGYVDRAARLPLRVFGTVLLLAFGLEAGVMVALDLEMPRGTHPLLVALLDAFLLTCALSPALWLTVVRPLRRLFQLRGVLLAGVFETQEQERARLARDLHDELGQHLTAIMVGLRAIEQAESLEQARERCRMVSGLGSTCVNEVRRLARGLRPSVLDGLGLAPALERLCEESSSAHGIRIEFRNSCAPGVRFDPAVETCVFRVGQEALTNVARHSRAVRATLMLDYSDGLLTLTIQDDGCGFDVGIRPRDRHSIGLDSMRERVSLLNGRFVLFSRSGEGTKIHVSIPCGEAGDESNPGHDR